MKTIVKRKKISKHFVNILEQILHSELLRAMKRFMLYDSFIFRSPEITRSNVVTTFS